METKLASRTDLETLLDLNRDYIRSVQESDVQRFDQILAEDFLCTNPDGSLVDRAGFLKQTAHDPALADRLRGRPPAASEARRWLKFPRPWPLSPEFPSHMGCTPAQDTPIPVEAEV